MNARGSVVMGVLRTKREQMVAMEERLRRAEYALHQIYWLSRSKRNDGGIAEGKVREIRRLAYFEDERE